MATNFESRPLNHGDEYSFQGNIYGRMKSNDYTTPSDATKQNLNINENFIYTQNKKILLDRP